MSARSVLVCSTFQTEIVFKNNAAGGRTPDRPLPLNTPLIQTNQSRCINELLERFQLVDSKPSPVLIDPASKSAYEREVALGLQCIELIGALNYASLETRPDISYAVGFSSLR